MLRFVDRHSVFRTLNFEGNKRNPGTLVLLYIFLSFLCRKINKGVILLTLRTSTITMVDDKATAKDLESWIEQLMECKQLSETQVKTLCEKVNRIFSRFLATKRPLRNEYFIAVERKVPLYCDVSSKNYIDSQSPAFSILST